MLLWVDSYVTHLKLCRVRGHCQRQLLDEPLNETLFTSLAHAHSTSAARIHDSNNERPHSALGCATPATYAAEIKNDGLG